MPGMRPMNDAHVAEPGLAVVEIAAADDATALAIQNLQATRWAMAAAERTTREPGDPGVRLRGFLDLRQEPDTHSGEHGPDSDTAALPCPRTDGGRVNWQQ
ncbi:DUF6207 family protein [Streptomyces sp. NPDC057621]|uniref:DUF6207 family protein n=1 Tax=Streptomyces sp. NPDC057621 TaxID=3346186 RepID=UPI0036A2B195